MSTQEALRVGVLRASCRGVVLGVLRCVLPTVAAGSDKSWGDRVSNSRRSGRRRAADRLAAAERDDCGCVVRRFVPMIPAQCPGCGEMSSMLTGPVAVPTSAPAGAVQSVYVGCACGVEYEVVCVVE